jgi:hypothetical protein
MNKPGKSPAGKVEATRRRRGLIATSIGVSALLALGGVAWAAGLQGTARASDAQGGLSGNTESTTPGSPTPVPATPEAGPSAAPGPTNPEAPGPAASSTAPANPPASSEADPAPVDRKGKSDQELAAIPQPVAAAVDLKSKKAVKGGISATITEMTAVQGVATGIGEVAGPAIRFKVTVLNDTATALPLDRAVVDVSYGNDEQPASQLSGPDPTAFPASVAPGESGVGVFIFAVPLDARAKVKIHFNLEAETPVATFAGTAPA